MQEIAEMIEKEIMQAGRPIPCDETFEYRPIQEPVKFKDENYPDYSPVTVDIMARAVYILRMAYIYVRRIDWMISGDDNEVNMAIRLKEDLAELKAIYPRGRFTFDKDKVKFNVAITQLKNNNYRSQSYWDWVWLKQD